MQIDAIFFLEFICQKFDEAQIKVLTAQEGVSISCQHFELMLTIHLCNFNNGDIKGAAAQIVNGYRPIALCLVHAIGKCRRGGLIDDALDLQARDAARILGSLTLGIVKICRHRNHGLGH